MVHKNRLKAYIPLIFSAIFGLVLFFLVDNFVVKVLVQPLLGLVWLLSLVLRSLPQGVLWAGFVILMLVVILNSFKKQQKTYHSAWQPGVRNAGPVETWAKLLESSQDSWYAKWRLSKELRHLSRSLLSPASEDETPRVDLSELELPAEIWDYFDAQNPANVPRAKRSNQDLQTYQALSLDPEVVLQYLRNRLGL